MALRILSLAAEHPCLSETFIDREHVALRSVGVAVDVFALRGSAPYRLRSRATRALARALPGALRPHLAHPRQALAVLRHAGKAADLAARLAADPDALLLAQFAWIPADIARLAATLSGRSFAVRVHAWDVFAQPPRRLAARLRDAGRVLPCTDLAAAAVVRCGIGPDRVRVVPHGLPLADAGWDWRPPRDAGPILGVGRLVAKKGVDTLLDAYALAAAGTPSLPPLEWVGDGPERRRLERRIAHQDLRGRVQLRGALSADATRSALRRASLLVLPSRITPDGDRDGIANVLLEAMAAGVPVLSTTASAAPELIEDGINGWLTAPDAPDALALALRTALDSPRRADVARAARDTVERRFDATANARALRDALRDPG